MNGEKTTVYDDKLVFGKSCNFFIWRGEALKMIIDLMFITTESSDAKLNFNFMDEMHFQTHARRKSLSDRILIKNYFNKRAILVSGLKKSVRTNFPSENLYELCERFCLITQEKQGGRIQTDFMLIMLLYFLNCQIIIVLLRLITKKFNQVFNFMIVSFVTKMCSW